jgi:polynucleotide 5'-kinase involved in rRNA processing
MLCSKTKQNLHVSCCFASPPLCQQGDTSSQSEPGRYLQAVQALVQRYSRLTAADVAATAATAGTAAGTAAAGNGSDGEEVLQVLPPLVINTPGWITGLGLDLLGEVLRCAAPTHGECWFYVF